MNSHSHRNDGSKLSLVRLGDSAPDPLRSLIDLRGYLVFGNRGKEIGRVTDFYVDSADYAKHYLMIEIRGIGYAEQLLILPTTIVDAVQPHSIFLNVSRDRLLVEPKIDRDRARLRFLLMRIPLFSVMRYETFYRTVAGMTMFDSTDQHAPSAEDEPLPNQ